MDKQLIKLYIIIFAALIILVVLAPMVIGKTSGLLQDVAVKASLLFYGKGNMEYSMDKSKGNIIFIFDDGWETQYTEGFKILKNHNLKASIAVISNRVGTKGYMDYKELADVYISGWDLLNHTYSHLDLLTLDDKEQETEINKGREWLSNNLFYRGKDIVVFPGSFYNAATIKILKNNNYIAGRSLDNIWLEKTGLFIESVNIFNLCSSESVEQAKVLIDKAIQNKSTCLFVAHKIETITDNTEMQFEPQEFETIVNYVLDNKGQLNVLTMTEFLQNCN